MPVIRLIQNRIFDEHFRWFRHELVQKCFQDIIDDEYSRSYHQDAVKFFEDLQEEKKAANDGEKKDQHESYAISKSYAYHLHKAGGKYREQSFAYNRELAAYASKIGDLDVAERSYKRAIDDAKNMGRSQDEMDCMFYMTQNVYDIRARQKEAAYNYDLLLKYYHSVNNSSMQIAVLNNIAMIHDDKGEYNEAIDIYNKNLEIKKRLGRSAKYSWYFNQHRYDTLQEGGV